MLTAFGQHSVAQARSAKSLALLGQLQTAPALAGESFFEAPGGAAVLFDGWLDNRESVGRELAIPHESTAAQTYFYAVERWGDRADLHLVGHYASVVVQPDGACRLSRSPIGARPLHWAWIDGVLVAASVPRLLEAAGLANRLDQRILADSLYLNLTENNGWLKNSWRLGVGEIVHVRSAQDAPRPVRYWQPKSIAINHSLSTDEAIAQTETLLKRGIEASLADAGSPGLLLSGGLDSSNVAARTAAILGDDTPLPSFTFVPSSRWDGIEPNWGYGDETSRVREFADMHPTIRPHFVANESSDFGEDWDRVFAAIGSAPPGLTNIGMYHGLFDAARQAGCDRLLSASYGNQCFSIAADWSVAEYVRTGRWREAWRQVSGNKVATTSRWRRLLRMGIAANSPDWLWRVWQRVKRRTAKTPSARIAALNSVVMRKFAVEARAQQAKVQSPRNFVGTRGQWLDEIFARGDMGAGEIEIAFEQIYGISQRDPTAYRPLIEHCLSLPTHMFARDGQDRWLARAMSRGHMPESQRLEQRAGMHNADWHARMTPLLPAIRRELETASERAELRELLDFDELFDRIDNWPDTPGFDDDTVYRLQMGIPIALMTARFIRHNNRWNA